MSGSPHLRNWIFTIKILISRSVNTRHLIAHLASTKTPLAFTRLSIHISRRQKSENGASDLAQSITRSEVWTAYRSICLPSMRYSLPTTSFNEENTIQSNRNIPLAVDIVQLTSEASASVIYSSNRAPQKFSITPLHLATRLTEAKRSGLQFREAHVTAGLASLSFGEPWPFLSHTVGKWVSSLCDLACNTSHHHNCSALSDGVSASDCTVWYCCLLALPSSRSFEDCGSFGRVLGADQECKYIARGYPMHSYRA
jgi:hypothetical protein